ncbi:tripartite tricarboxylate transporter substrate binding protein [Mycolicibacterium smegmatis]|jgi:tripartite-type tricarboxylate transporter receptor subunit TctC|uniref:tripartite tricarboxylate transporter substrate binding protein n=1 Tax=Mycolicibacterium smegmatis TaxID=1772 RepID=UPI0005D7C8C6|nr:tripartite tricarboxylate transporter substrate binding protein [Mycolicibacterium smegmatis]MCP2627791.1 tripartite tricarboxylate transporter substrate binding protein [Mycolicibacterium smegmatis]MDF1902117.1 tripartite tricarboxylate transporter substrate binding protein [Mycolicibacterium smegmatis]MDF1909608.1 tripartite tricarboxylate transporter substrate binding protein [Mycolicibacterium smegmatis]MDF1919936.1 tripartite tricarboxylate transporter substrate binding protein [Mycolic
MAIPALRRTRLVLAAAAAAGLVLSGCGGVQNTTGGGSGGTYPSGTVEMYVGASAGGSSDLISRAVSKGLSDSLGASFPVINREGANGALAAAEVSKAKPDGSVIAIQNASLFTITPLAVSPGEVTDIDDFDVVYGVSRDDYVLVTNPASGYKTIGDLEAATKPVRYGTTGVGTGAQLAAALLFKSADVPSQAVPFDGGAPALTALLGNQIDVAVLQVGEAIENIQSDKLIPLSVFGPERIDYLPEVPTAKEQGLDVEVTQYRFMTVPKGTPQEVRDRIVEGLEATFATDAYKKFNEQNSLTPMEQPGPEVLEQLKADSKRYADLTKEFGIDLRAS